MSDLRNTRNTLRTLYTQAMNRGLIDRRSIGTIQNMINRSHRVTLPFLLREFQDSLITDRKIVLANVKRRKQKAETIKKDLNIVEINETLNYMNEIVQFEYNFIMEKKGKKYPYKRDNMIAQTTRAKYNKLLKNIDTKHTSFKTLDKILGGKKGNIYSLFSNEWYQYEPSDGGDGHGGDEYILSVKLGSPTTVSGAGGGGGGTGAMYMADKHYKLNYQYIKYDGKLSKDNMAEKIGSEIITSKWLKKNYKENSCFYSLLIDAYKSFFDESKNYNIDFTYSYLWNMIHPDIPYNKDQALGEKLENMMIFFKKYHIRLTCLDYCYNIIYEYNPETVSPLRPSSLYILMHDNHIYRLNSGIDRLKLTVKKLKEAPQEHLSPYYKIREDISPEIKYIYTDDINKIDLTKKDENKKCMILYNGNMIELLKKFIKEYNYIPSIQYNNDTIIMYVKLGDCRVTIINPENHVCEPDLDCKSGKEYLTYMLNEQKIYKKLINRSTISNYSDNLIHMLNKHTRSSAIYNFCGKKIDCNAIDVYKAYTSNLMEINMLPVYNIFDGFEKYEGGDIREVNLYYIEVICNITEYNRILFYKRFDILTGYVILKGNLMKHIKILGVAKPYRYQYIDIKTEISELYSNPDIHIEKKKFIINKIIGLIGKKYNTSSYTKIITNLEEAREYAAKYDCSITFLPLTKHLKTTIEQDDEVIGDGEYEMMKTEYISEDVVYILKKRNKVHLENGFLPIRHFIYDIMRLKLQRLYNEYRQKGYDIYGVNTDAIMINKKIDPKLPKYESPYETIGNYRHEKNKKVRGKEYKFIDNENDLEYINRAPQNDIILDDEYDENEINNILDNNSGVVILADLPGSGKTTIFKKYSKHHKTLFVAPYRELCYSLKKEGCKACTLHHLLGITITGERKKTIKDVSDYDVIVFDEIYCNPIEMLCKIEGYIKNNIEKRYYATGDSWQLPPIGDNVIGGLNINYKEYHNKIIRELFPLSVTLKICKRIKDPKEHDKLVKLKHELFDWSRGYPDFIDRLQQILGRDHIIDTLDDIRGSCITLRNLTCEFINDYLHQQIQHPSEYCEFNSVKYYVGLQIRCRTSFECKKYRYHVNSRHIIDSIDNTKIVLLEPFKNIKMTHNISILKNFSLDYAQTCSSLQGLTKEGDVTIFNIGSQMCDSEWIWTAVTRCTSLKHIYIYNVDNKQQKNIEITHKLIKKVEELKLIDIEKNLFVGIYNYITPDDICNKMNAQAFQCLFCRTGIDYTYYKQGNSLNFEFHKMDEEKCYTSDNTFLICTTCKHQKKEEIEVIDYVNDQ